jgi:hypothetical protein
MKRITLVKLFVNNQDQGSSSTPGNWASKSLKIASWATTAGCRYVCPTTENSASTSMLPGPTSKGRSSVARPPTRPCSALTPKTV